MLSEGFARHFDKGRLRTVLALVFAALAVPTAVLIWQAYGQLKWEAFHQFRGDAEELTRRVDSRLGGMIRTADARSFADYTFLVVSGDPSANFVQRSPLSALPVAEAVPGALGYFQVDTQGNFSTPLLPAGVAQAAQLGIGADEYSRRLELARDIQAVLADNRLVQARPDVGGRRDVAGTVAEDVADVEESESAGEDEYREFRQRQVAATPERSSNADADGRSSAAAAVAAEASSLAGAVAENDALERSDARPSETAAPTNETYSQQVFDRLNQPARDARSFSADAPAAESETVANAASQAEQRLERIGKVSELKLDADLQKKSEAVEREAAKEDANDGAFADTQGRSKRREKISLPEPAAPADAESISNVTGPSDIRISTFESEVDPFEFSLLDSGHFVLFRKVWRDGERYIQGLLVDEATFLENAVGASFMDTTLSGMSNLLVAYEDDLLRTFSGSDGYTYPDVAEGLDGTLLYRSRLSAPLDGLELIFSINRLPPGPGAGVLGWVTLVLAIVFVGGFVALYRLGLSQIHLAGQQRDFVSAVSHELKTPLTSIRMYGEMLKEGWADEDKRQSYYEFIHDESERLSRLISNVLQLARLSRDDPQVDPKATKVGSLMSNIESKIASQVESAGFELRFETAGDAKDETILIDEDCFAQIIINLVDNAIKFSRDAPQKIIEIRSRRSGEKRIEFSVRDFGPGIPADQRKKIFQLFYRSESELTRETVGTGIGLAIVRQLTQAMHGTVDMVNVKPGAEFRITFPIAD